MTGNLGRETILSIERQCGIPEQLARAKARDIAAGDGDYYVTMPFGQYRGQTLGQIVDRHPAYFEWLASGKCTAVNGPVAAAIASVWHKQSRRAGTAAAKQFHRTKSLYPQIHTDSHRLNATRGSAICANRPQSVDKPSADQPEERDTFNADAGLATSVATPCADE